MHVLERVGVEVLISLSQHPLTCVLCNSTTASPSGRKEGRGQVLSTGNSTLSYAYLLINQLHYLGKTVLEY